MNEREIFDHALEIADESARAAYLSEVCGENRLRREHIEGLLHAEQMLGGFLQVPPIGVTGGGQLSLDILRPINEAPGARIGRYKLLQQIGEGGFGVVYMAEQEQPVRRKVALKIIKPGMDTKEVIARFESERQALALMDHPNIAKVLDAGSTEDCSRQTPSAVPGDDGTRSVPPTFGRPYFVMELVNGVPITDYCGDNHLPANERLELFIQVCNALQHAHQKGIIHRDLKPTNVMVTMHDGRPVPKVIDFGVAKAVFPLPLGEGGERSEPGEGVEVRLTERTLFTAYGQMIGTPAYMSPEQAELSGLDIDTRSDIYSLGVLLYELLTGTTPFEARRLREAGFDEMRRIIREEEPEKPSTRLAKIRTTKRSQIQNSETRTQSRSPLAPSHQPPATRHSELDWIVLKSLDKDRERRYESATDFARDIRRYLSDEPVQACPPSTFYRFRKFARKHRASFTTAAIVVASLLIGTGISIWQAVRATAAEAQATVNEAKAKAEEQKATGLAESETSQRKQAENNLEAALDALDRLMANVSDPELDGLPQVGPLRRRMLKDAIAFYERLPVHSEVAPDTRFRMAKIWSTIAGRSQDLRELNQWRLAMNKAASVLTQLIVEYPERNAYRAALSVIRRNEFEAFQHTFGNADFRNAERACRQAIEVYEELARREPHEPSWSVMRANAVRDLSESLSGLGKRAEALELLNEASRILDSCPAANDFDRAHILHQLARLTDEEAPGQADDTFRRGLALYRSHLSKPEPPHGSGPYGINVRWSSSRPSFGSQLHGVAMAFQHRHPEEAEQLFDESIAVWRELCSPPSVQQHWLTLFERPLRWQSRHLRRLAAERNDQQNGEQVNARLEKAEALFEEALATQRRNVARFAVVGSRLGLVLLLQEETQYLLSELARTNGTSDQIAANKLRADALLTEAIQLCRALSAEFPKNDDYKNRLAALLKLQAQHFGPHQPEASARDQSGAMETKP